MKRSLLFLFVCLLLVLRTVAQAPEKAAPDDLVVTAEIVGYSYESIMQGAKGPSQLTIHAKMTVRNTSDKPRDVSMMSCDWPNSWIANGPQGLFEPTVRPVCAHNAPTLVTIPAGEALIFNCPLLLVKANASEQNSTITFKLGFLDLERSDVKYRAETAEKRIVEKTHRAHAIYWSNSLTNRINLGTAQKMTGNGRYFDYHLTQNGQ